ncbi:leukocyte immunoglobulin-like receptor subfamily B member 2 isoform X3 [Gymnodraco acuticeps]|uniref:Leukocyte immunoglobulin-like receptor subfamily B member 2 isoform X3 n=1 Tax=Gymnodraco acuticeps TaxID=8218 RepID=A0A6P8SVG2_GYMAC|nr:leukocyte immunoglobulin-like receptor subfamily B member 2 isoform X3 [Gymnodraco acuticeps]
MNKAVVVFLKDQKYVTELKESGLMVNEEYIQVSPLATPSTRITVSGVPPFIPNEALERELKRFVPQQKPTLSVTSPGGEVLVGPDGPEVTWGQSVSISCSASTLPQQLFSKTTFILEKTSSSFRESRTAGSSSASFSIQEVNLEHEGWYRCQYQIRASRSPFSDSVRLSVSVPLQRPKLSVTSPSGGLFWSPEGAEVTRGHSFLLTCSIAPQYPGGLFSLLFSGSRLNVSRPAVNHSASFSFPAAGPEQQGSYSCLYEVTLSSSRTFTSTQEAPLTVIITCKCPPANRTPRPQTVKGKHQRSCDGAGLLSVWGGSPAGPAGAGGGLLLLPDPQEETRRPQPNSNVCHSHQRIQRGGR